MHKKRVSVKCNLHKIRATIFLFLHKTRAVRFFLFAISHNAQKLKTSQIRLQDLRGYFHGRGRKNRTLNTRFWRPDKLMFYIRSVMRLFPLLFLLAIWFAIWFENFSTSCCVLLLSLPRKGLYPARLTILCW